MHLGPSCVHGQFVCHEDSRIQGIKQLTIGKLGEGLASLSLENLRGLSDRLHNVTDVPFSAQDAS